MYEYSITLYAGDWDVDNVLVEANTREEAIACAEVRAIQARGYALGSVVALSGPCHGCTLDECDPECPV